jgi:CcmD family protein
METFTSVLVVAVVTWTVLIGYLAYLDSKLRSLAEKISDLQKNLKG